ncbi:ABHD3 [Bugula neritina]|uniref:ABHD3 n=1 Tax=Bugula neritina TaxID=10212 RepID=A0A7J7JS39_BUGNE|nr:ABHD3 [Bugula neritina]
MDLVSGLLAGWSNCVGQMSLAMKISLSCSMVFAVYYKYKICKPPQLFCQKDVFRKFLATCVPTSVERFSPFFMTFGTTLQTVIGGVMRTLPRVPWDKVEDIELPDNGLVHLHWVNNNESSQYTERERPIVLFLPGLTGNNESNYILHFITGVKRKGYRSVVFTYRGMGDQDLRTAKSYCACYTDDLEYVVNLIKAKYPDAPLMAVGISLGGMICSTIWLNLERTAN